MEEGQEMSEPALPAPGEKGRGYYRWSRVDTELVTGFFKEYINTNHFSQRGSLPGVQCVNRFLAQNPSVLPGISEKIKVTLIKTKVFNERKKHRDQTKFDTV